MPDIDQWGRNMERRPWSTTLLAVLGATAIVLIVVAIVGLVTTGSALFAGPAAKLTNPSRVEQKVFDPNNTVAQIAFFHNTCNQASAQVRIVENNQRALAADEVAAKNAKDPVRQQQAIDQLAADQQDVTGAQNALQTTVADYNSRSAQSIANVFKGTNLPDRIILPDPIPAGFTINCG